MSQKIPCCLLALFVARAIVYSFRKGKKRKKMLLGHRTCLPRWFSGALFFFFFCLENRNHKKDFKVPTTTTDVNKFKAKLKI